MSHPLLALQAADTLADQLRHRLDHLPERTRADAARSELSRWEAARAALQRRIEDLGGEIERCEAASHEIDRQRADLQAKLRTVIAPREAEALQNQIATLEERRGQLDDAELAALEEQAAADDELAALAGQEAGLREVLAAATGEQEAAEADIERQLTEIGGRLDGLRAAVDASLLPRYDHLRRNHLVAAAPLSGSRCEGCHLDLSAHEVDDVRETAAAGGYADCPQCGRMLVV